SRYNRFRIAVNVSVQIILGFSLPFVMHLFGKKDFYFSYLWPLKIEYLYPGSIASHPLPFVIYSFAAAFIIAPLLGIFFGKRWYCGWVCGCGGLANTFGEPWRHLSQKSHVAWKLEKFSIHTVLVLAIVTTAISVASVMVGRSKYPELAQAGDTFRTYYGFAVSAGLAGVVGTGLYPLGGSRIWCRYFCPMAAMLGLVQKFGRFRIRVKEDMCISCGLCSKYCEMGIDVRAYAQANTSFTRASCVGCGLCSEVCPRGVLRLENIQRHDPQELGFADPGVNAIETWKGSHNSTNVRY
ncbi:MAG: 4Fe-4S dicluster-binding protein, partial [Myxococcota bacterium]